MSLGRLVPMLVLIALVFAPFGWMGAGGALASTHHGGAMAVHCPEQSPEDDADRVAQSIDCMIACSAMTASAGAAHLPLGPAPMAAAASVEPRLSGLRPEAEPPPPRRA